MGRHKIDPLIKAANRRKWLADNQDLIKELGRNYRNENRERLNAMKGEYASKAKQEGLEAYGGKCQCCGEHRIEFLTIEHTEGRGAECYKAIEGNCRLSGVRLWQALKSKKWPRVGYALLCFNCNCAKGAFGYCPHEVEREIERRIIEEFKAKGE